MYVCMFHLMKHVCSIQWNRYAPLNERYAPVDEQYTPLKSYMVFMTSHTHAYTHIHTLIHVHVIHGLSFTTNDIVFEAFYVYIILYFKRLYHNVKRLIKGPQTRKYQSFNELSINHWVGDKPLHIGNKLLSHTRELPCNHPTHN